MTMPVYVTSGPYVRNNATLGAIATFPSNTPPSAGSFLVIQMAHGDIAGIADDTYTAPADWTPIFADTRIGGNLRQFLWAKYATGGETGTVSIGWTAGGAAGNSVLSCAMHVFANVTVTGVTDAYEGACVTSPASAASSMNAPDAIALGASRLAVCFGAAGPSQVYGDFTGETGGDWVIRAQGASGFNNMCFLQTAGMLASGSILGGSLPLLVSTAAAKLARAFCLIPLDDVVAALSNVPRAAHHYIMHVGNH